MILWLVQLNATRTTPFAMTSRNWLQPASWLCERFCSTVELLFVLCVERFAKFSTLLLHLLRILPCPAPQQNDRNHLACRNILPVSGCLFYRPEGSHFVHWNILSGRASFSLVILAACGEFCYSITLLAYCLVIRSLCIFGITL